jgi:hypothetical protein
VFDVKVSAQKKNTYTKVAQNDLALQFFKMGFFNPDPMAVTQALLCLEIMDFDGKDDIMQKVAKNGTILEKLMQYMQLAFMLSQQFAPEYAQQIAMHMQAMGGQPMMGGGTPTMMAGGSATGLPKQEHAVVRNAREKAQNASQPDSGKLVSGGSK